LEEIRATYQLNTEKLDYNYRVLTELDVEKNAELARYKVDVMMMMMMMTVMMIMMMMMMMMIVMMRMRMRMRIRMLIVQCSDNQVNCYHHNAHHHHHHHNCSWILIIAETEQVERTIELIGHEVQCNY